MSASVEALLLYDCRHHSACRGERQLDGAIRLWGMITHSHCDVKSRCFIFCHRLLIFIYGTGLRNGCTLANRLVKPHATCYSRTFNEPERNEGTQPVRHRHFVLRLGYLKITQSHLRLKRLHLAFLYQCAIYVNKVNTWLQGCC